MRYTRCVRYKERQWGQLAELQVDGIALQRDILVEQNKREPTDNEQRDSNVRLLAEIDERWGMSRTENADIAKKPPLSYNKWRAIEECLFREERVRDLIVEGEACDEGVPRWVYRNKKDTKEQWNWLGELCFYPRRQPVMESTEELGGPKRKK